MLHIVDTPEDRESGEQFLAEWATEHGIEDATRTVDDSGDVEGAIKREAADNTLVLIGATEKGLISRLVTDSMHMQVVNEVDASVLLAERPSDRTFVERLFGRGRREKVRDRRSDEGPGSELATTVDDEQRAS